MTNWRRSTDRDVIIVTDRDEHYPEQLRALGEYSPPQLYCRGNLELLKSRSLAIIGARDSTEYGDSVAEMFATDLARCGITIISGLARGIDGIAHHSTLAAGGNTIAVLGCGIDVYYPHSNARLQDRIAEEGLLISEFVPGTPAHKRHFPQRNRIIALLGSAVIVVEAGPRSGTRITVNWALDHGQTVYAVPGPIGRYESQGTNEIIQDGGHLMLSVRDVLEPLGWMTMQKAQPAGDDVAVEISHPAAAAVLAILDATARHVDEIGRRCNQSASDTLLQLLELELDGLVVQHPGKRFARRL
ncbi:MAG: DNA-processing protein DprA [Gemmatimonadota bacterium]